MIKQQYSNRSNCVRGAKSVLGKEATYAVDFGVHKHDDGKFTWDPLTDEAKAAAKAAVDRATLAAKQAATPGRKGKVTVKAERKRPEGQERKVGDKPLAGQPQALKLLKYTNNHERTYTQCAAHLGNENGPLAEHTIRGLISRLKKDGIVFTKVQDGRRCTIQCTHLPARLQSLLD